VKITDAHTGEVRYAKEITETNQSSTTCGETAQIDTTGLLKDAASKVANGLVMAVYPIQIAAVQADGTIMLNYGESALTPGNYYTVFQKAKKSEIRHLVKCLAALKASWESSGSPKFLIAFQKQRL
jgi:activator of 2-hydroxyglutaryl-CoA dehydratase